MLRKKKVCTQLTADEMKSQLYEHFNKSGALGEIGTQLRSRLFTHLFKIASPIQDVDTNSPSVEHFEASLLPMQVCNWLVHDHLSRRNYQYALSIFITEAKLCHPYNILSSSDILHLFGLDKSSTEYKSISDCSQNVHCHSLLLAIVKCLIDSSKVDRIQNEEESQRTKTNPNDTHSVFVGHNMLLNQFARTIDYPQNSDESRKHLGNQYSRHEHPESVDKEQIREIQRIKQKLVDQLDRLHVQEQEALLSAAQEKRELEREREGLLAERIKWKQKELLLEKELKDSFVQKTRNLEEEFQTMFHTKETDLEESRKLLSEKHQNLLISEDKNEKLIESISSLKQENANLNKMYLSLQAKYSSLFEQNTELLKKFENVSDYSILKEELSAKSKEVFILRQGMNELRTNSQKENQNLTDTAKDLESKLQMKETQTQEMERQLHLAQDTVRLERVARSRGRKEDSAAFQQLHTSLMHRIEKQNEDIEDLHRSLHILHYLVTCNDTKMNLKPECFKFPSTSSVPHLLKQHSSLQNSKNFAVSKPNFLAQAKDQITKLQRTSELHHKRDFTHHEASKEPFKFTSVINPILDQVEPRHAMHSAAHNLDDAFAKSNELMKCALAQTFPMSVDHSRPIQISAFAHTEEETAVEGEDNELGHVSNIHETVLPNTYSYMSTIKQTTLNKKLLTHFNNPKDLQPKTKHYLEVGPQPLLKNHVKAFDISETHEGLTNLPQEHKTKDSNAPTSNLHKSSSVTDADNESIQKLELNSIPIAAISDIPIAVVNDISSTLPAESPSEAVTVDLDVVWRKQALPPLLKDSPVPQGAMATEVISGHEFTPNEPPLSGPSEASEDSESEERKGRSSTPVDGSVVPEAYFSEVHLSCGSEGEQPRDESDGGW